jgi:hypothetical protein
MGSALAQGGAWSAAEGGGMSGNDSGQRRVTIRTLVTSAWRTAPPVLRRFAFWSWLVGLASVAAAVAVDVTGGWPDLPVTMNLLSDVISALIAVPIALLVVSQLAAYQVEETTRPQLEARVGASRHRLTGAVEILFRHLGNMEREATAATNEFVRAIQVGGDDAENGGIDLAAVNRSAWSAHSVMDATEWVLFQRLIQPVRVYCTQLHDALIERSRGGEFAADIEELERLQSELESAVANHSRVISQGQRLFGHQPAVSAYDRALINDLRNVAITYIKSIDRMLQLCQELQRYATRTPPLPPR